MNSDGPPARTLRLFVGAWPPKEVVAKLAGVRMLVADPHQALRWTEPEKLHLTLCFMGEVEERRLSEVEEAIRESWAEFPPISAWVRRLGGFPDSRRARVIWAGVEAEGDGFICLALALRHGLTQRGIGFDNKPISPHITLARVSRREDGPGFRLPELEETDFGPWTVDSIRLVQSVQDRVGSDYRTLAKFPLMGGQP